ncbi:unnamed protein product [Urochloa decumbens]|uniref:Dolichol kinase n=1 Tax=Urochloa decumbens TaxID=240449 RepID=A0ABC9E2E6_9POAL
MILAVGMVMQLGVDNSNEKQVHKPTFFIAYGSLVLSLGLSGLVWFRSSPSRPHDKEYVAIKLLLHACVLCLVSLCFSLSLMLRMKLAVTATALAAAVLYVLHRLWQCYKTALDVDLDAYRGCEEVLQQLIELSTMGTSMLLSGWFSMAFYYFQNYPEEARDARFVPSEHITFLASVALSLMLVKSVPRPRRVPPLRRRLVCELAVLICLLFVAMVTVALVIAASKVGTRGALLALIPEAAAAVAFCTEWATDWLGLPSVLPEWLVEYDQGGAQQGGETPPQSFFSVALMVLLAVLSYHVKNVRALSTLYDEVFVLATAGATVAALGWRFLVHLLKLNQKTGVQAAAKTLACFAFLLLMLSVLALPGFLFGW